MILDDTIARKVNASDASAFAKICGCFPSQGTPATTATSIYADLRNCAMSSMGSHLAYHCIHILRLGYHGRHHRVQGMSANCNLVLPTHDSTFFVAIGSSAGGRREALVARAGDERRACFVTISPIDALQYIVLRVSRLAIIMEGKCAYVGRCNCGCDLPVCKNCWTL